MAKELRLYQARLIADVCRADGDVLVEQPTGSGKTLEIVTLIGMQLGRRFSHAVVAAPQEQIEHCFVHRDYDIVAFPESLGVATTKIRAPENLILGARESRQLGSIRRVKAYLRQEGPIDHALACTHAALTSFSLTDLPSDLSKKALFVDEAHHASADGLGEIVTLWRERGGQLFFFTATPYRRDGRRVRLDGMRVIRRSLAEHMSEGFAPGRLDSEIVALGRAGDIITPGQFTGEEGPPASYLDSLRDVICCRWLQDEKPKAIVRVPPMQEGRSAELVKHLADGLRGSGARILDATGTGTQDKQRFLNALRSERNRSFETSQFDVIIGIQRVFEGTDWPLCSAVYCVGMPGSLNTVVQLLGRAARKKEENHPLAHRDQARLAFFVPCAGGSSLSELSLDHSRHALLTCCFLADHEVGQEWIVLREVRRGIEAALGPRDQNPVAADVEKEAEQPLDLEVRSQLELALATAREQILSSGNEPTAGELVRLAGQMLPDLPRTALNRIVDEILAAQPGAVGEAVRGRLCEEVSKRLRIDPQVKKALEDAFGVVLDEFRDVTLSDSVVLQSVGRQIHRVTAGQMHEFAQRLRDAAPRQLTEEQVLSWVDQWHERTGKWPSRDSGTIPNTDERWSAIDGALKQGTRGLVGNSSLARLLFEHRGVRNIQDLPELSVEMILGWADLHHKRTGRWPTVKSGPIVDASGETWQNINQMLAKGGRGLPGGSSLRQLLAEHRKVRNDKRLPNLSVQQILAWADAHHKRTGQWPTHKSGPIVEAPGETWRTVDNALRRGRRGLPGKSSLAQLLAKWRGVRNVNGLPALSVDQILTWADAHYERTQEWPTARSGPVVDAPGETWVKIDQALAKGLRGLNGGSSLAKLLTQHRGVRNRKALQALSVDQILFWADAHYRCRGQWPTRNSGPLADSPGDTWARIDQALVLGLRTLPRGSSLAKLLSRFRGVRNIQDLPRLHIHQILAWADAHRERTGQWPTAKSGTIIKAPGETWANVNQALIKGLRGFPGRSSLAKVLAEHRGVRNKAKVGIGQAR